MAPGEINESGTQKLNNKLHPMANICLDTLKSLRHGSVAHSAASSGSSNGIINQSHRHGAPDSQALYSSISLSLTRPRCIYWGSTTTGSLGGEEQKGNKLIFANKTPSAAINKTPTRSFEFQVGRRIETEEGVVIWNLLMDLLVPLFLGVVNLLTATRHVTRNSISYPFPVLPAQQTECESYWGTGREMVAARGLCITPRAICKCIAIGTHPGHQQPVLCIIIYWCNKLDIICIPVWNRNPRFYYYYFINLSTGAYTRDFQISGFTLDFTT